MLAADSGKCIPVFLSRRSVSSRAGHLPVVRGIRLADGQKIVSMTMIDHVELENRCQGCVSQDVEGAPPPARRRGR